MENFNWKFFITFLLFLMLVGCSTVTLNVGSSPPLTTTSLSACPPGTPPWLCFGGGACPPGTPPWLCFGGGACPAGTPPWLCFGGAALPNTQTGVVKEINTTGKIYKIEDSLGRTWYIPVEPATVVEDSEKPIDVGDTVTLEFTGTGTVRQK